MCLCAGDIFKMCIMILFSLSKDLYLTLSLLRLWTSGIKMWSSDSVSTLWQVTVNNAFTGRSWTVDLWSHSNGSSSNSGVVYCDGGVMGSRCSGVSWCLIPSNIPHSSVRKGCCVLSFPYPLWVSRIFLQHGTCCPNLHSSG